jgi:hypothetical protein
MEYYKILLTFFVFDMVCYSSMSSLPLAASILYYASIICSFSCCALLFLCSASLLPLYSVLSLHAIRCTFDLQFRSCTRSHSTHVHNYQKKSTLFYVLHHFIIPSPLRDNPPNSLSYLVVIPSFFIISGLS